MSCPVCGNAIDADFGVVTCGHCNSVLFVDMDGNIQVNGTSGEAPAAEIGPTSIEPSPGIEMSGIEPVPENVSLGQEPPQDLDPAVAVSPYTNETVVLPDQSPRSLAEEIGDFANSENATVGALSYWVRIEGIDTKEVRAEIERVFSDSKLMLDWRDLVDSIEFGVLEIKQLNPVKASRLVQKLNELPVKVSWRQSVYDN